MTLLRTALIWDINLTYQAQVPKSEPTDNAQPNGSRLSCGRPARRARVVDDSPCPPARKHSASLKAITARQLQALVRQRGSG